jgi:hypothetical protein
MKKTQKKPEKIFHISENGEIETFKPRPSPAKIENLAGDVVFGISEKLLHNYLLPRDCPRVTFYASDKTSPTDKEKFLPAATDYVIAVEAKWFPAIQQTTLFCYEFDGETFSLIDECAGYYVSYKEVKPLSVKRIDNILDELFRRNDIELRILPELWSIADKVSKSSLNFSLIRMRNAIPKSKDERNARLPDLLR